jgi:5-methylcytosine-specific restriction endonuclease McrA
MRKPQTVANLTFKTKKELHTHTEKKLEKRGVCEIDKLDKDYQFFLDLYKRKPSHQSYVENITKFKISLDPIKKTRANYVSCIDNNNKEYVFSWRSCCDGIDTKVSDKLKEACRTSIQDQTSSCWLNNDKCHICKESKKSGYEVDHVIEFSKIYKEFMEKNIIAVPEHFESDTLTSQTIFRKEDYIFKQAFQDYHEENAILQLLCNECHKKKTKKFISKK